MKKAEILEIDTTTKVVFKCPTCGQKSSLLVKREDLVITCFNHECGEDFKLNMTEVLLPSIPIN